MFSMKSIVKLLLLTISVQ